MQIQSVADIGQQRNDPGAFDRGGQLTLMLCTGAGDAAGKNLGALGNVFSQLADVLIVNLCYFIHAECANFPSGLSVGSVVLFFFHSSQSSLSELERQFVILNFFEFNRISSGYRRCLEFGSDRTRRVFFGFNKVRLFDVYLKGGSFGAGFILIIA